MFGAKLDLFDHVKKIGVSKPNACFFIAKSKHTISIATLFSYQKAIQGLPNTI